jgi:serine/threonine protein kinase
VYLIQHLSTTDDGFEKISTYAMKVYKKSLLIDSDLIDNTMQERQLLLDMKNPYILKMHYAFQTVHRLYFILDFVSGRDLFYYIR